MHVDIFGKSITRNIIMKAMCKLQKMHIKRYLELIILQSLLFINQEIKAIDATEICDVQFTGSLAVNQTLSCYEQFRIEIQTSGLDIDQSCDAIKLEYQYGSTTTWRSLTCKNLFTTNLEGWWKPFILAENGGYQTYPVNSPNCGNQISNGYKLITSYRSPMELFPLDCNGQVTFRLKIRRNSIGEDYPPAANDYIYGSINVAKENSKCIIQPIEVPISDCNCASRLCKLAIIDMLNPNKISYASNYTKIFSADFYQYVIGTYSGNYGDIIALGVLLDGVGSGNAPINRYRAQIFTDYRYPIAGTAGHVNSNIDRRKLFELSGTGQLRWYDFNQQIYPPAGYLRSATCTQSKLSVITANPVTVSELFQDIWLDPLYQSGAGELILGISLRDCACDHSSCIPLMSSCPINAWIIFNVDLSPNISSLNKTMIKKISKHNNYKKVMGDKRK